MKKRFARSLSPSVIDADASIRQNITACVVGFGRIFEASVAQIERIDIGDALAFAPTAPQFLQLK